MDTVAGEMRAQLPGRPWIHLAGVRQVRIEWDDGSGLQVRVPWWNLWRTRRRIRAHLLCP